MWMKCAISLAIGVSPMSRPEASPAILPITVLSPMLTTIPTAVPSTALVEKNAGMYSSNLHFSLAYKYQRSIVQSSPHSIFQGTSFLFHHHTQWGKIFLEHMYQASCNLWDPFFLGKAYLYHNKMGNDSCNLHFSLAYKYQELFALLFWDPIDQDKPFLFLRRTLPVQIFGPVLQQPMQELRCKCSC